MSRLKQLRTQRKLSVERVSAETGIPKPYLVAMEEGRLGSLPPAHRQPYLDQYQKYLGASRRGAQDALLEGITERATQGRTSTDVLETTTGTSTVTSRGREEMPVIRLLMGSFVVTMLLVVGFRLVQVLTHHNEGPVAEEAVIVAEAARPARASPAAEAPEPEPAPERGPERPAGHHQIAVRTIHPVRIEARVGDEVVHDGMVEGGQTVTAEGEDDITLEISDLSRVHIEFDGNRIEPLHNLSSARRLVFVRDTP